MDETRFLMLMRKARTFSHLGGRPHYWHGYQRGLRRGLQGELFGTDQEHERWMGLADEGGTDADRECGRGYRDALVACAASVDGTTAGISLTRGGVDPMVRANRLNASGSKPYSRR